VYWFHKPYQQKIPNLQPEGSIYKSSVTGKIGEISLLWHRMYPIVLLKKDPKNPKKPIVRPTSRYLELITIFPDGSSQQCNDFLNFLKTKPESFQLLWGE